MDKHNQTTLHQNLERALSMQEAMDYLTLHGFPCRSRATFYRLLENFDIPHTIVNPGGKHAVRRFPVSGLQKFLKDQGLDV